tara:strand:+ start:324 stop:884 length:561 start_codon:yes stop_codon:yes gene_type:complete
MKILKIFIFIFISLFFSIKTNSNIQLINTLEQGGKLIFIRHAYAPGNGDPSNFDINDCSTQRNLNQKGIQDSINLGVFFIKHKIAVDSVISSEWCRCKDTAFYAFNKFEKKIFLNSFYDEKFFHNKTQQIIDLKDYIKQWNGKKNLVLITHYVVISEILNIGSLPAEIIVADRNFNLLGRYQLTKN